MDNVVPVEQPFWFSITDAGRSAAGAGPARPVRADCPPGRLRGRGRRPVRRDTGRGRGAGDRARAQPGRPARASRPCSGCSLSAFEVTLLLDGDGDGGAAASSGLEPAAVWPVDVLREVTDRFEISRDPQGIRCRVTRPSRKSTGSVRIGWPHAPLQHPDPPRGGVRPARRPHRPDVHVRPDRLQPRPHRQLPDLRLPRRPAPRRCATSWGTTSGR